MKSYISHRPYLVRGGYVIIVGSPEESMGDVEDGVDGARPPPPTSSSGRRTSRRRRTRPPLPAKPTDLSTKAAAGIQYQLLQQQQNTREGLI